MSTRRSGFLGLGSVAAPVVIFFGVKVFLGVGPAPSPAADGPGGPALLPPPATPPLSPEQQAAVAWLEGRRIDPGMASPLDHPAAPVEAIAPAPEIEADDPLEGLSLTALLSTGTSGWATINGANYCIGQTVPGGLILRAVDARAQRIELVDSGGVSHWLARED